MAVRGLSLIHISGCAGQLDDERRVRQRVWRLFPRPGPVSYTHLNFAFCPGQVRQAVAVMPLAAKVLKQVMVNTGGNKRQVRCV